MTTPKQLKKPRPPKPTLIDERMKLFLERQLNDTLDHLSDSRDTHLSRRTLKALQKLRNNNFGACERCSYPIDIGRILTDPAVETCACCEHGLNCPVGHPLHRD